MYDMCNTLMVVGNVVVSNGSNCLNRIQNVKNWMLPVYIYIYMYIGSDNFYTVITFYTIRLLSLLFCFRYFYMFLLFFITSN